MSKRREGVLKAKEASAAARSASPPSSAAASELRRRVDRPGVMGHSPAAGSPWRSGLREILQPSALPKAPGVQRDPRASDQAEGPCGAACPPADPGRAPILLPKYQLPCAPKPNRNRDRDLGGRERDGFIFLPGRREDTAG